MRCKDCEYVKCYAVNKKMYYCDNRNRTNLMGKLGEDVLPETIPEWCPMADRTIDENARGISHFHLLQQHLHSLIAYSIIIISIMRNVSSNGVTALYEKTKCV